jgi:hypothetical protein
MRFVPFLVVALVGGCGGNDNNSNPDLTMSMDMAVADAANLDTCDAVAQTGCAGGQHCTVGTLGGKPANVCTPTPASPLAEGAACSPVDLGNSVTGDQCATGTACVAEIGISRCRKLCFVHSDCTAGGCVVDTHSPQIKMDPSLGPLPLWACTTDDGCDPIQQTGCSGGLRCVLSPSDGTVRLTVCGMATGTGGAGANCTSSADCQAGYRCGGLGFCRQLCYYTPPDGGVVTGGTCPSPVMCSPIVNTTEYGECNG